MLYLILVWLSFAVSSRTFIVGRVLSMREAAGSSIRAFLRVDLPLSSVLNPERGRTAATYHRRSVGSINPDRRNFRLSSSTLLGIDSSTSIDLRNPDDAGKRNSTTPTRKAIECLAVAPPIASERVSEKAG